MKSGADKLGGGLAIEVVGRGTVERLDGCSGDGAEAAGCGDEPGCQRVGVGGRGLWGVPIGGGEPGGVAE